MCPYLLRSAPSPHGEPVFNSSPILTVAPLFVYVHFVQGLKDSVTPFDIVKPITPDFPPSDQQTVPCVTISARPCT